MFRIENSEVTRSEKDEEKKRDPCTDHKVNRIQGKPQKAVPHSAGFCTFSKWHPRGIS